MSLVAIAKDAFIAVEEAASTTSRTNPTTANSTLTAADITSIDVARTFFSKTCNDHLSGSSSPEIFSDDDRLIKAGRHITSVLSSGMDEKLIEASLSLLVEEFNLLADTSKLKVPHVRFGKTNLSIPIVTLGCMRFQQAWGPSITCLSQVTPACQSNLLAILRRAISLGINHIETARGYGCSELQIGAALRELFGEGFVKREELIIQTKAPPKADAKEFRRLLETSFTMLGLDYVDLFSFHGVNMEEDYGYIFGNGGGGEEEEETETCLDVVREYLGDGRIRHLGFSTHGSTPLVKKLIQSNIFSYANVHYHFCGSYTASGQGSDGMGHRENIRLMTQKDMGVFVISPYDKGGKLYAPSTKLRSLTLPEMEPMTFGGAWLWHRGRCDETTTGGVVHTMTVGAARPSDLDQPVVSAVLYGGDGGGGEERRQRVDTVMRRLEGAAVTALGEKWVGSWYKGLPTWLESPKSVHLTQIVSLYNLIVAYGMLEYARDRYAGMESSLEKWDDGLSKEDNVNTLVRTNGWGWVPGLPIREGVDYTDDLVNCPEVNRDKLKEVIQLVHEWCRKKKTTAATGDDEIKPGEEKKNEDDTTAKDRETSFDMRPWTAFPERPKPSSS